MNTPIIVSAPANKGVLDKLIGAGLIVGGLWYARKLYRDWRSEKLSEAAGGDPNIQAAIEIHQAIDGAGTDEKELFNVAAKIADWKAVAKAYHSKYNSDMLEDIKGDLNPEDFQKFMNIYNLAQKDKSGKPVTSKNVIEPGVWVFVEKDTNIRKTPRVVGKWEKFKNANSFTNTSTSNVIALAKPGKYLGVATGRQAIDTTTDQGTLFIEVRMGFVGEKSGAVMPVWVASSQVRTEKKQNFKPTTAQLIMAPLKSYENALAGLGEKVAYETELVLNSNSAAITDEQGNLMAMVHGKGLILGYPTGVATKCMESKLEFITVQGQSRWVPEKDVIERRIK